LEHMRLCIFGIVSSRAGFASAVFGRGEGFAHSQTRFVPFS